jgi:hypothetical protein
MNAARREQRAAGRNRDARFRSPNADIGPAGDLAAHVSLPELFARGRRARRSAFASAANTRSDAVRARYIGDVEHLVHLRRPVCGSKAPDRAIAFFRQPLVDVA